MLPDLRALGVEDRNGDGIIDYIASRIYVADDAGPDEIAAAANLAARLAFETVSMDLPIAFPISEYQPERGTAIFVARAASSLQGQTAIRLPVIADAELFGTLDNYRAADRPQKNPRDLKELKLSNLLSSTRQIVLGPDVRSTAVIDLAARVALESTELRLPLVTVARKTDDALPRTAILVGLRNPYVEELIRAGRFSPPGDAGTGCVAIVSDCAVIAGADTDGENRALAYAALRMPYIRDYGKGRVSISSIEDEIRRYCPSPPPTPQLIFEDSFEIPWEVDLARDRLRDSLARVIRPGDSVEIDLRLSEPPEVRRAFASEVREILKETGADPKTSTVRIRSAHKQGFFWIDEELKPLLGNAASIQILFRELKCAAESVDTADRWLHELYPIDEILARDLRISPDAITFERIPSSAPHTYEVIATDAAGKTVVNARFDPRSVDRPLFDLFPEYAHARVSTGWLQINVNGKAIVEERIETDYERFWDIYQAHTLPKIRDYILRLHGGNPRPECAPHFDQLIVEVQLSEPDFPLGIDEERISTLEALHEDIYFETLLFFDVLGVATCGKPLKYPGRIIPRVQPARSGPGRAQIRFTGYNAPASQNKPFAEKSPSVTAVTVRAGQQGADSLEAFAGARFSWLLSTIEGRETIDPRHGTAPFVQWDEPIGPAECEQIIKGLASYREVRPFLAGRSWLGRPVWAIDVTASVEGRYFSQAKASALKPCLFITGRQHANEVSSTSHILKLVELLATDPAHRKLLDRVDFIIQPMTNPDGAALVEELHKVTPDFMLHAGYLGALGVDVTDEQWSDDPKYPEARIRADLWRMWQPDIVLNPHGYPSHEWVQLFAGYTAWVRSRRVQARDWWIPRGWFMPRFDFVDDDRFPQHRRAALMLRDRIADAVRATFESVNNRMYRRYQKYRYCELDLHHGVLIQSPAAGCKADPASFGFMSKHPEITFFEGLSEAPDEVASGEWLKGLASVGLEFSLVHARFLAELPAGITRTRWTEPDAHVLHIARQRLSL